MWRQDVKMFRWLALACKIVQNSRKNRNQMAGPRQKPSESTIPIRQHTKRSKTRIVESDSDDITAEPATNKDSRDTKGGKATVKTSSRGGKVPENVHTKPRTAPKSKRVLATEAEVRASRYLSIMLFLRTRASYSDLASLHQLCSHQFLYRWLPVMKRFRQRCIVNQMPSTRLQVACRICRPAS